MFTKEHGITSVYNFTFAGDWSSHFDDSISIPDLYIKAAFSREQVIQSAKINLENPLNGSRELFLGPNTTICGKEVFVAYPYYFFGDCYVLELPQCVLEAGILEIAFKTKIDVDIFLHHWKQFLNPNSQ